MRGTTNTKPAEAPQYPHCCTYHATGGVPWAYCGPDVWETRARRDQTKERR